MQAKYRGTCPRCTDPIEPGQDIISAGGRWMHEPCRPPRSAATELAGKTGEHRPEHDEEFSGRPGSPGQPRCWPG